ncbi:MAG: right-handed parallel beta-helix repeat-containing protein [Sedimentisphaerales bacterium]|nr:right-handed parallel beta-helix repeat-containing protein [Sedimentisphaerales bacterium]
MKKTILIIQLLIMVFLLSSSGLAAELLVPSQYSTIQSAVNASSNGDTIKVSPGTYYEAVDLGSKSVNLISTDPNDWDTVEATVIDANQIAMGVRTTGSGTIAIIKGFTVKNASSWGIYCSIGSKPAISRCIIKENGVGVYGMLAGPSILENKILNNTSNGIMVTGGTAKEIKNNLIQGNGSSGIQLTAPGVNTIVRNNTVVNNAVAGIKVTSGTPPTISNCIIWDSNDALINCSAKYSCIDEVFDINDPNFSGSNSNDPCFVDPNANDFSLSIDSIQIDTGDPDPDPNYSGEFDIDANPRVYASGVVDKGSYELSGNQNPVAVLYAEPPVVKRGDIVVLDGSESYDPDGEIVEYKWVVGDGSDPHIQPDNGYFTGKTVHVYETEGVYTVTLTIKDNEDPPATDSVNCQVEVYPYTLTVSTAGHGTVAKNPDRTVYATNEVVTLTATPSLGWSFKEWSGDLSGSDNPTTITMNSSNKSVQAVFESDLVAWYKMNDDVIDGYGVLDSSGNNYHGTSAYRDTHAMHTDGKINGALQFNGLTSEGDYINIDNSLESVFQNSFSVNLWVKSGVNCNNSYATSFLGTFGVGGTGRFSFGLDDSLDLSVWYGNSDCLNCPIPQASCFHLVTEDTCLLETDEFHMVTVVIEDTSVPEEDPSLVCSIYFDKDLKAQQTYNVAMDYYDNDYPLYIGATNMHDSVYWNFQGGIDNVMIFDRALNAEEIADMYSEDGINGNGIRYLTTSATSGGTVSTPGIGTFSYIYSTDASIVATANNDGYHFAEWTGTAVDAGAVADPLSDSTTVTMDADYTVRANFNALPIVSGGYYHSLFVKSNGTVYGCGWNIYGAVGSGSGDTGNILPTLISVPASITSISAGRHSLAVDTDGYVWAWGSSQYGQIGVGTAWTAPYIYWTPVKVLGEDGFGFLSNITKTAAGASEGEYSLALDKSGDVWAWGRNHFTMNDNGHCDDPGVICNIGGQLGINYHCDFVPGAPPTICMVVTPHKVLGLDGIFITDIDAGACHSIACGGTNGNVWTWGYNEDGELGNGDGSPKAGRQPYEYDGVPYFSMVPVKVKGGEMGTYFLENIVDVAVLGEKYPVDGSNNSSYALDSSGNVWAWGTSWYDGQLGDDGDHYIVGPPETWYSLTPVKVHDGEQTPSDTPYLEHIVAISAGSAHILALDEDGYIWAWGSDNDGQLGNGSAGGGTTPVKVQKLSGGDLSNIVAIDAGGKHSMAVDVSGNIWVWGWNGNYRMGLAGGSGPYKAAVELTLP